jgi:toll-like receptor 13
MIGRRIDECIMESVERSRKTLMLITNAFAKSEWCMYELFMAQHKLIDADSDSIVLALMEDIKA